MKRVFKILGWLLLVLMVVGTIYFLYKKSLPEVVVYKTYQMQKKDLVKQTVATGKIVPRKEVNIKPQINGIIDKIYLEAGDMVKAGDIIAKVNVVVDAQSLSSAQSRLKLAQIQFKNAEVEYKRQKGLYDKGVIAQNEFQTAQVAYSQAKEDKAAAEDLVDIIQKGVAKRSGSTTNTLVKSTTNGKILDIPVKEGNSVIMSNNFNDGTTIATVADMTDMIFEGSVDETEVDKIVLGSPIKIGIGAIDNTKLDGKLTYVSPKGTETNGAVMFDIKADVKLAKGVNVRAGYSANANIELEKKNQVNSLPESTIEFVGDSTFVEVLTSAQNIIPQTFEKKVVKLGLSDGVNIQVISGISDSTKVKGELVPKDDPKMVKKEE